jgi:hypothetical protein
MIPSMRAATLMLSLSIIVVAAARATPTAQSGQARTVTFTADIAPLLAAKCQPCHFKGGKVFDKLPFDQYKTVVKIAPRLNTRLKGKDGELVARWIEGGSPE